MYKESKWAKEILALQDEGGSWGYFHTLSEPKKRPMTTEQALRRLAVLGYTAADVPIQRAIQYLDDCLRGKQALPDRREKSHNWDIFTSLMLATWIRRFTKQNNPANQIAEVWGQVISAAFAHSEYNAQEYANAYLAAFGGKPKGSRLVDFACFYQVSLIADQLDEKTESAVIAYLLSQKGGIYYIYGDTALSALPEKFASRQASRYLGAIELLSVYPTSRNQLAFVSAWLISNQNKNGKWDMGSQANDKVYFPLSDSWRSRAAREADCTYRIQNLLDCLG